MSSSSKVVPYLCPAFALRALAAGFLPLIVIGQLKIPPYAWQAGPGAYPPIRKRIPLYFCYQRGPRLKKSRFAPPPRREINPYCFNRGAAPLRKKFSADIDYVPKDRPRVSLYQARPAQRLKTTILLLHAEFLLIKRRLLQ